MSPGAGGRNATTPSSRSGPRAPCVQGGRSHAARTGGLPARPRVLSGERSSPEGPLSLINNVIRGSNAGRLLLLAHGFGADERDLGGLLPYLDPEGRFVTVLPRGPVAVPGMPGFAWYDFG